MNQIAVQGRRQTVMEPRDFGELMEFAKVAANSDFVPKDFKGKPGNIMIAVQWGAELGLPPMQALNSVCIINGRPGVWGDGLIGLVRQSPLCVDIIEKIEGEGDARTATCTAVRKNSSPVTATFSIADAKRAGLINKDLYKAYPDRMIQNRARGFALRDAFPDVLRGMRAAEELYDTPADAKQETPYAGVTLDAKPEPIVQPPSEPSAADKAAARHVPKRTYRDLIDDVRARLGAAGSIKDVEAIGDEPSVRYAAQHASPQVKQELMDLLGEAMGRFRGSNDASEDANGGPDDVFPGDIQ